MRWDYVKLGVKNLRQRQLRSWLTMIGIFIGIATVVSLISLGAGLKAAVASQFSTLGTDRLVIQAKGSSFGPPGQGAAATLTKSDLRTVQRAQDVKVAAGRLLAPVQAKFNDKVLPIFLASVPNDPAQRNLIIALQNVRTAQGRFPRAGDGLRVTVGYDYTTPDKFGKAVQIGDKILLNGQRVEVIGILARRGSVQFDSAFLMDEDAMRTLLNKSDEYSVIAASVVSPDSIPLAQASIMKDLRSARGVKEGREDFTVQTPGELLSTLDTVIGGVTAVLVGIAFISLIVGGIGIMNTMYTAILERTREIGIMKAVGARNNDILFIFMFESGLLGLLGGIIGAILGIILSVSVVLAATGLLGPGILTIQIDPWLLVGAVLFSFIVGLVAGTIPAYEAAKLPPVEALSKMTSYFSLAVQNLVHRKKRAWLTVIGIFIGIMAVVALISLGQGLKAGVNAEFAKLGVDKIFIQPSTVISGSGGGTGAAAIGDREVKRALTIPGVREATGISVRPARVDWGETTVYPTINEVPSNDRDRQLVMETFSATEVGQGRTLNGGDVGKALIGSKYLDTTKYRDALAVGRTIKINNVSVVVVGVLAPTGDPGTDESIFVVQKTFEQAIPSAINSFDMIIVRIEPGQSPHVVADQLKDSLRRARGLKAGEEDFTVQTTDDISASFESILAIIQYVLAGVALISLLVGAVGIMNTMYTAVLERTKEIGIMKAIGARNNDILTIFLIESGLLGLGGGAVGVLLGLGISYLASIIAKQALGTAIIQFYASWWLILGGLAFSFLLGTIAGYFPARAAAKQQAVDSLRYE